MKRWQMVTAAVIAAAPLAGWAYAQETLEAKADQKPPIVKQLSDEEFQKALTTIEAAAGGEWIVGYRAGVSETGNNIHRYFVPRMVQQKNITQEAADKIKAEIDRLIKELDPTEEGEGDNFDGKAAGSIAIVKAFGTAIAALAEDGLLPEDQATQLTTNAGRLTARSTAASLRAGSLRNLSGGNLISRGLANNRAVSEEQVEQLVEAMNSLKSALPDQAEAIDAQIFKVSSLTIGREAPNIKGVDTDEVEFALKDYRGKVVALDFWGDW